jgi:prophage regulatory protein
MIDNPSGDAVGNKPREMLVEHRVLEIVPIARSTLKEWVRTGKFPAPVPIGERRLAWYADEIAEWQRVREKQRSMPRAPVRPQLAQLERRG